MGVGAVNAREYLRAEGGHRKSVNRLGMRAKERTDGRAINGVRAQTRLDFAVDIVKRIFLYERNFIVKKKRISALCSLGMRMKSRDPKALKPEGKKWKKDNNKRKRSDEMKDKRGRGSR